MKRAVILILLLVLTIPISTAVEIQELFTISGSEEVEEFSSGEPGVITYFYSGKKLLATKELNGQIEYKYQDRLGSDINTKTLPFGQEISSDSRFSFTGKELDKDLYYFGARYYDSDLGKFTSIDPLPTEPAYQYVSNNPMNLIDPSGKEEEDLSPAERFSRWIGFSKWLETPHDPRSTSGFIKTILGINSLRRVGEVASEGGTLTTEEIVNAGIAYTGVLNAPLVLENTISTLTKTQNTPLELPTPEKRLYSNNKLFQADDALNGRVYTRRLLDFPESVTRVENGRVYDASGKLAQGKGYIFVVDKEGNLIIAKRGNLPLTHPHLSGGEPVQGAGILSFDQGRVQWMKTHSGHFFDPRNPLDFNEDTIQAFMESAERLDIELKTDFYTNSPPGR